MAKATKKSAGRRASTARSHIKTKRKSTSKSPLRKSKAPPRTPGEQSKAAIHPDIRAYNADLSAGDKRICDALAQAIHQTLTQKAAAGLESKIWHRHPVWFIDGNPIVGYHKLKDCVRLLFWSGRSFDEPGLPPEGNFQTAGARYNSADEIDSKNLKRWLEKSIAIQWDYKNIVKRKGRLERLK